MIPIRAPRCLGIGRDRHHRLRRRPEQQIVDDRLVLPGDVGDLGRQREDDVEIADRKQVGLALGEPCLRGGALTLRGSAGCDNSCRRREVAAVVAGIDVAAERSRPAVLDRRHDLELGKAQVTGLSGAIAGSFSSEDIGDLRARRASGLSRCVPRPASASPNVREDWSPSGSSWSRRGHRARSYRACCAPTGLG